jgi:uncharacterized protein YndB with AHSA1/START domain
MTQAATPRQTGINAYRFLEQWFIPFPPEQVWDVLADGRKLPLWWKGVYLKAEPLTEDRAPRVGAKLAGEARGFLPYHLKFTIESIELERPRVVMVRTVGDLTGTWRAELAAEHGGTRVSINEQVLAEKPLLRLLTPLLKPLFAANHRWTTPRGEAGLTAYLRERQTAG